MNATVFRIAAALALGVGAIGWAHADAVKFTGFAHGSQAVKIDLTPDSPFESWTISAGGFATLYESKSFTSYCVDLFEVLPSFGSTNTTYTPVAASAFFGAKTDDVARLFSGVSSQVDTALEEAAFQLALWEIKYETSAGPYLMTSGTARFADMKLADGNAVNLAQSWLDRLATFDNRMQLHVLQSVGRPGKQDVVWATPVPEPGTWLLMAAGVAAVGALTRRRASPLR